MDKLMTRIEYMINFENDNYFVNINIDKNIENILYDYQLLHLCNLITAFRTNNVIIDGSDTGTGKTYTSIALCRQLKLRPIIVCPKIVINEWKRVCEIFDINPISVINYESLKSKKNNNDEFNNKFIQVNKNIKTKKNEYTWNIPHNSIVIFDEAHRCKNVNTQNAQLLMSSKKLKNVLMLSATLTDKPNELNVFGYMLGLYNNMKDSKRWINAKLYEDSASMNKKKLSSICSAIYPNKGSRMQISELKDKFPENKVTANAYSIGDEHQQIIEKYVERIKNMDKCMGDGLVLFTRLRQYLEDVKVDIIKDLIDDHLENDFSIVVFLNYTESINKLAKLCNTKCIVNGEVSIEERENNIANFQSGQERLIICNIQIESISLHDVQGNYKRVSLISPNFSSTQLIQALGRIYRTGAKTACLQKIIFCGGTYEETICEKLKKKLEFVEKLNSNELVDIEGF